jgi:hypothetical protein
MTADVMSGERKSQEKRGTKRAPLYARRRRSTSKQRAGRAVAANAAGTPWPCPTEPPQKDRLGTKLIKIGKEPNHPATELLNLQNEQLKGFSCQPFLRTCPE